MSLLTAIKQIQESVAAIPNINCGGCAVFAALLGQQLNKRKINFKVRVADDEHNYELDAVPIARARNCVRPAEWETNGVGFGHVFFEVEDGGKKLFFDSNTIQPAGGKIQLPGYGTLNVYHDPISLKETVLIARDKSYWTSRFNRKRIPLMIKNISAACNKSLDTAA